MSTTRRSLSPSGIAGLLVALVGLVTVAGFIASTVQATSITNALINQRVASGEVVAQGHVLVRATSAPDSSAAPETTTSAPTTTTTTSAPVVAVPPVTTSAPVATTSTPVAPRCQEDEPCWNPCTMGNMGPCDMGTELPYGGRFAVTMTPDATTTCDQVNGVRYVSIAVTVSVVSGDRVTRHDGLTWYGCVLAHAPFAGGEPVELAPMFRIVAGQL